METDGRGPILPIGQVVTQADAELFQELLANSGDIPQDKVKYPEAAYLYISAFVAPAKIGEWLGLPVKLIRDWIERDNWNGLREGSNDTSKSVAIKNINDRHIKAVLSYSHDIVEQVAIVGNNLMLEAYDEMGKLDTKDKLQYAYKFKELEARLRGQVQSPVQSTTNIIATNNTVYQKIVEEGFEGIFNEDRSDSRIPENYEIIEAEPRRQLPTELREGIKSHKVKFSQLSDEELDEALDSD